MGRGSGSLMRQGGRHRGIARYRDLHPCEKTTIPDSTGPQRPPRPPLEVDRPEHTPYRRLLAPYFSAEQARQLEPRIREIAAELIHTAIAERECDLVPTVAVPMPALVLCAVLGLPSEDWSFLKRSTAEVIEAGRAVDPERHARANDALYSYVHSVVEARRAAQLDPGTDIITGLMELVVDGRQLDDDQVTGVVRLLLQAGHNTTTNGLGSAFRYLAAAPQEQARLREDPTRIPAAVDEILRAFSPAQMLARTVTREVQMGGRTLRPGDKVGLFWASANRDPEVFADPERVNLGCGFRIVMSRSGMASTGAWALPWRGPRCAWPSRRFLPARGDSTWSGRHPRSGGRTSAPGRCRSDFSENVGFR